MTGVSVIQGSVKTLPQGPPEVTDELDILVRGYGLWHSMQIHNFFKEQIGHLSAFEFFLHAIK